MTVVKVVNALHSHSRFTWLAANNTHLQTVDCFGDYDLHGDDRPVYSLFTVRYSIDLAR